MEKKKQPFSNQVRKHKRILYDLFVTIENIIIGNSPITRSFQGGCDKYTIRSRSNHPTVLLVYEKTTSLTCLSESNISSMELERENSPQIEIVETNEQTTNINTKKVKANTSNADIINQCSVSLVPKPEIIYRRVIYDLFLTIENIIICVSSITREVMDGIIIIKIKPSRNHPMVIILYDLPLKGENNNSVLQVNGQHISGNTPNLSKLQSMISHSAKMNITALKAIPKQTLTRGNPYKCEYCKKTFPALSIKLSHERQHTGEKPYKCDYCEKAFVQLAHKVRHQRQHTGEKPYKCQYCEKTFADSYIKKCHERKHTGEKPYKCDYCEKTFIQPSLKVRHERLHTGEKPYKCEYCAKTFMDYSSKKAHGRLHTGEKPYKCDYCEKTFTQRSGKKYHERMHTGEKPYECDYCEKTFTQLSGKKYHERRHTGERPYKCEYCEKIFVQLWQKIQHQRQHTGEKPYKCEYCERTFAQSSAKNSHERQHTGDKPYTL